MYQVKKIWLLPCVTDLSGAVCDVKAIPLRDQVFDVRATHKKSRPILGGFIFAFQCSA